MTFFFRFVKIKRRIDACHFYEFVHMHSEYSLGHGSIAKNHLKHVLSLTIIRV